MDQFWSLTVQITIHLWKSSHDSSKSLLYSTEDRTSYGFGTTLGWVIDDKIIILSIKTFILKRICKPFLCMESQWTTESPLASKWSSYNQERTCHPFQEHVSPLKTSEKDFYRIFKTYIRSFVIIKSVEQRTWTMSRKHTRSTPYSTCYS